ncbi:MAG: CBS domain-containing protein [Anaerolineae bacterium]|nr:CBS domain-containing protein [Anaerolineae bacterium]
MNTIRQLLALRGTDLWTIRPHDTVFEALRLMADKDVGALVVVEGHQIVGMISERDYARKVILLGRASTDTLVGEIMSTSVVTIHPDQTVEEALALMSTRRIRHLPVLDAGKLVTVISLDDVVRTIIYHQRQTIKFYEELELDR